MILSLNSGWNPIFSGFRESGSWGLRGSPCEAPFGPLNQFRRTRFDSGPRFLDFSLFQKVERWTPRFRGNEAAPLPGIPRVVPPGFLLALCHGLCRPPGLRGVETEYSRLGPMLTDYFYPSLVSDPLLPGRCRVSRPTDIFCHRDPNPE